MANFRFEQHDYTLNVSPARTAVSLQPGWGVHRLSLHFEVKAIGSFGKKDPHTFAGELQIFDLPGTPTWIGDLTCLWPLGLEEFGTSLQLSTSITEQQLRGLEKARAGADLTLHVNMKATRDAEADAWPAAQGQERLVVPHAEWSRALSSVDTSAYVDVLVPITDVEGRSTAARRIREAQEAIRNGQFEQAVTLSRGALDAVREANKTLQVYNSAKDKNPRARNQAERWAMLTQAAYDLCSGAPHDDAWTTELFTWTRADAVAAVATAAGLLARLEDLA
ncbi:hypothetical protein LG634_17010 [Streptomyces bambusae]|uniref:hypothetical protein n=1 Tax=Streptomyces bambusae TaxID=1550616 RepID=UPI001CFEE558|nr:hypothetical protein [Streptomyces bambusae]MCB5166533.1 hypothetical protein [Streptomyces bambusae]